MLKAIAFRIILKPDPVEEVTKSGLILKKDVFLEKGATVTGTIVDIGPDAWQSYKPSLPFAGLQVGNHVYYAKYAGKWIRDQETKEEFLVVNDDDIVAQII